MTTSLAASERMFRTNWFFLYNQTEGTASMLLEFSWVSKAQNRDDLFSFTTFKALLLMSKTIYFH